MSTNLAEICAILEASPARRREPSLDVWRLNTGPWWRLFTAYQALEETKARLLTAAWRLPLPLFLVPEEPLAEEWAPFLTPDPPVWRIDRTRTPDSFHRTEPASTLGNWQLYAAPHPVGVPGPDCFRARPDEVLRFMRANAISLLIDVFHDDTDWCIAVCDDRTA